jgi:hypothetical protein
LNPKWTEQEEQKNIQRYKSISKFGEIINKKSQETAQVHLNY